MSGFDDDFSENSFDETSSSGFQKDEPPTLDETIFDFNLFQLFLNYMKSHQAAGNLMFLKDARKFRLMNQPRDILIHQASKLVMMYFCSAAPYPVSVSDELKKKISNFAFDPACQFSLDKDSFSVAFGEVFNAVAPHFRDWISTNEWREAIPFHRIPPPSFSVVLSSVTLSVLFNKFLKSQLTRDSDGSAAHAYHLWKYCLIVNDFREGKHTHDLNGDGKKKKKKDDGESTDAANPETPKEEEKQEKPEDYAKRVYKKYKHHISLIYDKTMPHAVFIVRALDRAIEEFDKSELFARWVGLKQYQGVDYQAKIVHQSLTPEGYAEPPSLAASMSSQILPAFMAILQGTEQGLNLEFLTSVLTFHRKFIHFENDGSTSPTSSAASSDSTGGKTRKDMIEEAKRIFAKYLEKGEMYCDPGLVDEIRNIVTKGGGKGVTPSMFRKAGTFIYHRAEHSWCREARATFDWTIKSYDNQSKGTRSVEEEFSLKNLPENFDLQLVPSLDDVYGNPDLFKDYAAFVDDNTDKLFQKFLVPLKEYFAAPALSRKPILQKIMNVFSEAAVTYPELVPVSNMVSKELGCRDRIPDSILHILVSAIARSGAARFYKQWIVEHSMVWKSASWSPVSAVRFGDLSLIMGMSTVETKIEEAALKGKSGFSRYLAKRQVKKQSVSVIRAGSTSTVKLSHDKAVLNTDFGFGGAAEKKASSDAIDVSLIARIPSIEETLSSPYLRIFFMQGMLEKVLSPEEMDLFTALSSFFKKYNEMSNERICEAQKDIQKDVVDLCDKYKGMLPKFAEMKDRAKKLTFILPNFFRPLEVELFGKHHSKFEGELREKGWK